MQTCIAIVSDGKVIVESPDARPVLWWSFAKTVLAAAVLVLVRDEKLTLDTPVKLPSSIRMDLASGTTANTSLAKPYTLRNLLRHTAGVPSYSDLDVYGSAVANKDFPWSVDEMLERVQYDNLLFKPGEGWRYSNTGYLLIRKIIEATVGADLDSALQQLVLRPLDIENVRVAASPVDLEPTEWGNPTGYHPGWVFHGLLIGKPAAAALLLDRLITGHLLPAPLLADMLLKLPLGDKLAGRPSINFGYGMGLMIASGGPAGGAMGHTGAGPMSVAAVYRFVECGRTVATFAPGDDQAAVEWEACGL